MSRRTERLASVIRQELAMVIQRDLSDPRLRGFPSITRVQVLDDLSMANIYVTIMGTPGQQTAALNALRHSAGLMRTHLTKVLSIRQVPYLQFHIDENLKKELELLTLLQKVSEEHAELDRKRGEDGQPPADENAPGAAEGPDTEPQK